MIERRCSDLIGHILIGTATSDGEMVWHRWGSGSKRCQAVIVLT